MAFAPRIKAIVSGCDKRGGEVVGPPDYQKSSALSFFNWDQFQAPRMNPLYTLPPKPGRESQTLCFVNAANVFALKMAVIWRWGSCGKENRWYPQARGSWIKRPGWENVAFASYRLCDNNFGPSVLVPFSSRSLLISKISIAYLSLFLFFCPHPSLSAPFSFFLSHKLRFEKLEE